MTDNAAAEKHLEWCSNYCHPHEGNLNHVRTDNGVLNGPDNYYYLHYHKHNPASDTITSNATALFIMLYRHDYYLYSYYH